jgi:predicted LPLAT superfamily acyltransferase
MIPNWVQSRERGSYSGVVLLARLLQLLGSRACLAAAAPVVFYFFLTGTAQRRASRDFRRRARAMGANVGTGYWAGLRHALDFAAAAIDRFSAWHGDFDFGDISGLDEPTCDTFRHDSKGAVVLTSHLGSFDVLRAIGARSRRRRVIAITHSGSTANYARALASVAPDSQFELLEIDELDIATAVRLSDAVDQGAWIVIGADRLPPKNRGREITTPFLGAPARFPQGPFVMAAALRCPVYTLFCIRRPGGFHIHVERLAETLALGRRDRERIMQDACAKYAAAVERRAIESPYQWYNFFDFWASGDACTAEFGS